MSPRRHRRRPDGPTQGGGRARATSEWTEDGWVVRTVTGAASGKTYRCPGCDHEIRPGVPHMVTWPDTATGTAFSGGLADRRHWHTPCWRARHRRRPR